MQSSRFAQYSQVVGMAGLFVSLTSFNPTKASFSEYVEGFGFAPYGMTAEGVKQPSLESLALAEKSNTKTEVRVVASSGSTPLSQEYALYHVPLYYNNARGADGLRILHLSDLHFHNDRFENTMLATYERVLREENAALPLDLVLITGDITFEDGKPPSERELRFLKALPARYGHYYVLGNHDYYHGVQAVTSALDSIGYRNLTNQNTSFMYPLVDISQQTLLYLIGLDDWEQGKHNYAQAFAHVPKNAFSIVLTHNLDALNHQAPASLDLILSGHTHACEVDFAIVNGCSSLLLHDTALFLNEQTQDVKALAQGTLSYVNPGLHHQARHMGVFGYELSIPRINTLPPGVAILTIHDSSQAPSGYEAHDLALEPAQ